MKIEVKPKYVIIKQQAYCCVPTAIQMIFTRRNIPLMSQEDIGWELGLIVPKEDEHLFKRVRVGPEPKAGYETQIKKRKYYLPGFSLDKFFKKCNIPLQSEIHLIEKVKNAREFIEKQISEGNDMIVCFNYKKLFNKGNDGGHVSLISAIDEDNVELADPAGWFRTVKLIDLVEAMKYHGAKNMGGFWVIK